MSIPDHSSSYPLDHPFGINFSVRASSSSSTLCYFFLFLLSASPSHKSVWRRCVLRTASAPSVSPVTSPETRALGPVAMAPVEEQFQVADVGDGQPQTVHFAHPLVSLRFFGHFEFALRVQHSPIDQRQAFSQLRVSVVQVPHALALALVAFPNCGPMRTKRGRAF